MLIDDLKKGDKAKIKFAKNTDGKRILNVLFRGGAECEKKDRRVIEASILCGLDREDAWVFTMLEDGSEFSSRGILSVQKV